MLKGEYRQWNLYASPKLFPLISLRFAKYRRRNNGNKSSMNLRVYIFLCSSSNRHLRRVSRKNLLRISCLISLSFLKISVYLKGDTNVTVLWVSRSVSVCFFWLLTCILYRGYEQKFLYRFYFPLCPQACDGCLRGDLDNKTSKDFRVHFFLCP